jgi:DNA-binding beta-propeller fold protein YncE
MGMDLDDAGRLYVARLAPSGICVFGTDGEEFGCWGSYGSDPWSVTGPADVALDGQGRIYVAELTIHSDVTQSGLQLFTIDGTYVANFGRAGYDSGQIVDGAGVAIGPDGNVYLADPGGGRVHVFGPDGTQLREWPASAFGIAIDEAGFVYAASEWLHRVGKYTPEGELVKEWGTRGMGPGQFDSPQSVDLDAAGHVYVADTYNHRIQVFTSDGTYLTEWGGFGYAPGQFYRPMGVHADDAGNVYVADTWNGRIQHFGPAPTAAKKTSWARIKGLYR